MRFNFKCWLLLFFSGFWWCACTACGWSQFDRFWYRVSILWSYSTKHAHSIVGFRLFPVLLREVILRVIRFFPFLKLTIRFETPVHFQTGAWRHVFVSWVTKTWRDMKTWSPFRGVGRGLLFKTKKRSFRLFSYSLTRIDYFASHTVITWLNAALDNRHNQINTVAFIWGLQEKTRYNFVIYAIQTFTILSQWVKCGILSVPHHICKWFIVINHFHVTKKK